MGIFSDVLLVSDYDDTLTQPGGLPGADGKITKMTQIPQANLDAIAALRARGRPVYHRKRAHAHLLRFGDPRAHHAERAARARQRGAYFRRKSGERRPCAAAAGQRQTSGARRDETVSARGARRRSGRANMCVVHCPRGDEEYYQNLPYHVEGDIDSYPGPWIKLHFSGPA